MAIEGAGNDPPKIIPVKAVLRGRPLIKKEIDEGCEKCLEFIPSANQVVLGGNKAFTFDNVFDADIGQEEVYNTAVKPLTEGIFKGYHATVLAYGQTGSGKTYSMGSAHSSTNYDDETTGIIPRVIADIFTGISEREDRNFTVKVSYLELYKKDLHDLLCSVSDRQQIMIRDAPDGGTQITGLTELEVTNTEETLRAMDRGNSHRTTAATAMNLVSSRSHAIFTVLLESLGKEDANDKICSKFHLVDLAGSERAKRTKAEGERLQEGIKINEGLLALGNVISALADENLRSGHIKYRDSKLTRILQSSLGGNSHTLMIACVSPADSNHEETLNTLRYADRVRKIKNKPVVNRDPQAALIVTLKQEIQALNLRLLERGGGDFQPSSNFRPGSTTDRNVSEKLRKLEKEISDLKDENTNLTEQLQQSVDRHADMCEKAILAEMDRDKVREQLEEVILSAKSILTQFPDLIVIGQELENQPAKDCYLKLAGLQKLVLGMNTTESANALTNAANDDPEKENYSPQTSFSGEVPSADHNITAAHAMKNADLGKQLQELTKALSMKEALARKMTMNDVQMTEMKDKYETKLQELDKDIQNLVKEKANLELALQQAQKTNESRKLSEKRRQRVVELESQIQDLKKERKEKEKLVRMKTESDRSIERLNREIQEMKRNRVTLMKQIKAENEKFNAWKKEKAKEVKQLQEKNRKRNFEYVKLERTYDKQKAILRRKTEEAAAANRRLKEALSKQQAAAAKRRTNEKRTMDGAGPKIRAWLDEEIEVLTSMKEAEHHLNLLLEDRKSIARELQTRVESPSKRRRTFDPADLNQNDQKVRHDELRQELKLKNAQIQDMQNKLADAKEHHSGNSRWTHIGTMLDAKCALRYLLQLVVSLKFEEGKQKEINEVSKKAREAAEEIAKKLELQMRQMIHQHQEERTMLEQTHQDEISVLMTRMGSVSDDLPNTPSATLERVVTKQAEVIGTLKEERKELHRQLLEQKTSVSKTPLHGENPSFFKPIKQIHDTSDDIFDEDWEEDGEDEDDAGSEYEPTPQKRKRVSGLGCKCSRSKFPCKGGMCGCVKKGNRCGDDCKCSKEACYNRQTPSEESHNGTFVKSSGNATFNTDAMDEGGPSNTSTPTYPSIFPKLNTFGFDKENAHPDIIPRTPMDGETKSGKYTPVYFSSPLNDQN